MVHKPLLSFLAIFLVPLFPISGQNIATVKSPDEGIQVSLALHSGRITYAITHSGIVFLEDSPLGLKTSIGDFSENLNFQSADHQKFRRDYTLSKGKAHDIQVIANELVTTYTNSNEDTLQVIFRVSDSDVAFRYRIATKERKTRVIIKEESTGFNLPDDATTYITPQAVPMTGWEQTKPSYEENYVVNGTMGIPSKYGRGYTFPALFMLGSKGWVLLSESGVDGGYPGSRLGEGSKQGFYPLKFPQPGENGGIGDVTAATSIPMRTPWRTITLGKTLKPIVESTVAFDYVAPRYQPSRDYKMGRATWSWILWQDGSINFEDQKKYIDLASALDFEYTLVDNWWDRGIGRDKIQDLVRYAESKGVGVLLWYNSNGFWNDAPQTPQDRMHTAPERQKEMAWLREIGVKGLKVDFFGGDKQVTMKFYEDILTDANAHGLLVTVHGSTLPRGWEAMYPNFVTSEAVKASEMLYFDQEYADHYAENATILPFTRNAVGAMDFGPVFLKERLHRKENRGTFRRTTDAFEIATSVLFLSPVQYFGLTPEVLQEPEFILDFLRSVPTVWDETRYISGAPGKHCAIARRKGSRWYVALVNGEQDAKTIALELPMLAGKEVEIIYDQKDRNAALKTETIGQDGTLEIAVLGQGGAMIFQDPDIQ